VDSAVYSAVDSAVDSAVRSAVNSAVYSAGMSFYAGSLWPGYASWVDYFNYECDIPINRNYLEAVMSCGYFWMLEETVFASERPSQINRDAQGSLHSDSGMSISYPSGWGLFSWHGVQVPEQVIVAPGKMTPQSIMAENNAQVRMVMIERYGFDRFMLDAGAKTLDTVGEYRLVAVPDPEWGEIKALKMICPSTSAVFVIPVDPRHSKVTTALDEMKGVSNYLKRIRLQT
jgi:hypothetical protein